MKKGRIKLKSKIGACLLILSLVLLPVFSSVCIAQEGAGPAAAGAAGPGGISGLSTAQKIGIAGVGIGLVAIIIAATSTSSTTNH